MGARDYFELFSSFFLPPMNKAVNQKYLMIFLYFTSIIHVFYEKDISWTEFVQSISILAVLSVREKNMPDS